MNQGNWNYPTTIYFGCDRINELSACCEQLSMRNPLLVCDAFVSTQSWYQETIKSLPNYQLFCDFKSNPDDNNINDGVAAYKQHQCDGVITLGGGSAMDCGKTIALMVAQTRPLFDFIDAGDNYKRALSDDIPKIIAIPTTSGTGSEVGRAAVIANHKTHNKQLIFHPRMLPSLVICDPKLTLSVPAHLTAASGMDALAHNLEAYFSPHYHPMADGIALEGTRLIKENLVTAYQNGNDLKAREQMMVAATMGATAFQKGLGLIHSLSHPVGGLYDAHHGLLNAIFMPYVLQFNREAIETKCQHLCRYLAIDAPSFDSFYQWIIQLCECLNIPTTLRDIGIDESQADLVAELAIQDPSCGGNPKELTINDCKQVFLKAVDGALSL